MMLNAAGCAARRRRLMKELEPPTDWAIVADPKHLMYLANWPIEPFSWASQPPGLLLVDPAGRGTLVVDNLAVRRPETICADRLEIVSWYNHSDTPGDRRLHVIARSLEILAAQSSPRLIALETRAVPFEFIHCLGEIWPRAALRGLDDVLLEMRQVKDPDELDLLGRCLRAGEAGHERAWEVVRPGATELDVYREVASACIASAGMPVVVYGDFCSGPRTWTDRGGPPTSRRLEAGDLVILDFSVVIGGYRGDFTNTIAVGERPNDAQRRLFDRCMEALTRGEEACRPGASAAAVWHAMNRPLKSADPRYRLPGHAGHGIGLAHPEPPILVPNSAHILAAGNVITLEPGLYVEGVGGMRFEHNYLVTDRGVERLTRHLVGLGRGEG